MIHASRMCLTGLKWNLHQKCWLIQQCSRTRVMFLKNSDSSWACIARTHVSFWLVLLKTNQMRPLEVLKTAVFRTCHLARFGLLKTMLGSQCATAEDVIQQVCHSWGRLLRKGCATCLTFHLQAQDSVVHKQHVSLRQSLSHSATTQQTEHLQSASNVGQIFWCGALFSQQTSVTSGGKKKMELHMTQKSF